MEFPASSQLLHYYTIKNNFSSFSLPTCPYISYYYFQNNNCQGFVAHLINRDAAIHIVRAKFRASTQRSGGFPLPKFLDILPYTFALSHLLTDTPHNTHTHSHTHTSHNLRTLVVCHVRITLYVRPRPSQKFHSTQRRAPRIMSLSNSLNCA